MSSFMFEKCNFARKRVVCDVKCFSSFPLNVFPAKFASQSLQWKKDVVKRFVVSSVSLKKVNG